jgi:branched-chain amino acid transport system permease protein
MAFAPQQLNVAPLGRGAATRLLNGSQALGRGPMFWTAAACLAALALLFPLISNSYQVNNISYFLTWVFMALGLSLMWGYAGIMSFGQTLFFGLAGYCYGVLSINLGADYGLTFLALAGALALAALVAMFLGYFMFYGNLGGIFVGIVTLAVTLALAAFLNQTGGPRWVIGSARLNGYNGMGGMPPLTLPWFDHSIPIEGTQFYYLLVILVVATYLALRLLVNSRIGNVFVAIRENPERAEMLGYDTRWYRLLAFVIGSALAGVSGVLYVAWGQFITPATMALPAAAIPTIWVAVSGRQDLTATLIGTMLMLYISQFLALYSLQYALVVLGTLLVVVTLFAPSGLVIGVCQLFSGFMARMGRER